MSEDDEWRQVILSVPTASSYVYHEYEDCSALLNKRRVRKETRKVNLGYALAGGLPLCDYCKRLRRRYRQSGSSEPGATVEA